MIHFCSNDRINKYISIVFGWWDELGWSHSFCKKKEKQKDGVIPSVFIVFD